MPATVQPPVVHAVQSVPPQPRRVAEWAESKKPRLNEVQELEHVQTTLLHLRDVKPMGALQLLKDTLPCDEAGKAAWRSSARVAAVLGSCPRTLKSFMSGMCVCPCILACACFPTRCLVYCSGLRHWVTFIDVTYGTRTAHEATFPPHLADVLAWSNTFRSCIVVPLCIMSDGYWQVFWYLCQLSRTPTWGMSCVGLRGASSWSPSHQACYDRHHQERIIQP